MSVDLQEEAAGKVLVVKLSGKLTKGDYKHFVPEVERLIGQHRKLRVLCEMHDFHGWTAGACGKTSSSTSSTLPTSSDSPSSATGRGNMAWPCSASPSRRRRFAISMPARRTRPRSGSMPTCP